MHLHLTALVMSTDKYKIPISMFHGIEKKKNFFVRADLRQQNYIKFLIFDDQSYSLSKRLVTTR